MLAPVHSMYALRMQLEWFHHTIGLNYWTVISKNPFSNVLYGQKKGTGCIPDLQMDSA